MANVPLDTSSYPKRCQAALNAQTEIGWSAFLRGYWAQAWTQLQGSHLSRIQQHNNTSTGQL
jgi:hypothetical protein